MTSGVLFPASLAAAGGTVILSIVMIGRRLDDATTSAGEILSLSLLALAGALSATVALIARTRNAPSTGDRHDALRALRAENTRLAGALAERSQAALRFQLLVDHAPEAIVVLDADTGVFREANPQASALFGLPLDDLIGAYGPADLSPERQPDGQPSKDAARKHVEDAAAGAYPTFEWQHQAVDGTLIDCAVSLTRLPDPERRLVCGTITDISDRKQAADARLDLQKQRAQAQKLETIGQMTGGVAHEFNNLLTVILGNLELLQDVRDEKDAKALIEAAVSAAKRGANLTRSMLSFARRAHLNPVRLDLNDTLASMDGWMWRNLPETIRVETRLEADLWPVKTDLAAVENAILNVVANARDAMEESGTLTLTTANAHISDGDDLQPDLDLAPGRYVALTLSDTGSGIPPELLSQVFNPFFTTKSKGRGENSGLGLSMVHGFMKQSGGAVGITSEPGVGTHVRLYFPAHAVFEQPQANLSAPEPQRAVPPARILLAEDRDDVMTVLKRALEAEGHQVIAARNGDVAADLFSLFRPIDMLVTDVVMPGDLQGFDLATRLRRATPELPVIFMSGYGRGKGATPFSGPGDIHLMKPVPRETLVKAVAQALSSRTASTRTAQLLQPARGAEAGGP